MKPLTRAQKKMLYEVAEKGKILMYGSWPFRCARNLRSMGLVTLNGPTVYPTSAGLERVLALKALEKPQNPPDVWHPVPVKQATWLSPKWTCTTKENAHEAYPEDHKYTCDIWHYKEETARQHAAKLNRKAGGRVHTKDG